MLCKLLANLIPHAYSRYEYVCANIMALTWRKDNRRGEKRRRTCSSICRQGRCSVGRPGRRCGTRGTGSRSARLEDSKQEII